MTSTRRRATTSRRSNASSPATAAAVAESRRRLIEAAAAGAGGTPDSIACRGSLAEFTRRAWHVIEPDTGLTWNWHHDAICRHLEAVFRGALPRLIINVPPGSSKSTIACVMWPAWAWLHRPAWRGFFASYAAPLANRDSLRTRDVLASEWYRDTFRPGWLLRSDANTITHFGNTASGWRRATSVGAQAGGHRGDCWVLDDPHNPNEDLSDAELERSRRWIFGTFWNRLNDLRHGGRVIIMQRLHQSDATGMAIDRLGTWSPANPDGWAVLRLPAEYEPDEPCRTPLGFADPRTEPGELLDPLRMPAAVLDVERQAQGERTYAAQYQQRPAPKAGAMFRWERVKRAPVAPRLVAAVRYWDKAGTADAGAYTAGVLVGADDLGRFWVLPVARGRWSALDREQVILATSRSDAARLGRDRYQVHVEQEPGSGGKESAEATVRMLAGFDVHADRATGRKEDRARPVAAQVEAGNVYLAEGDDPSWVEPFLQELAAFPYGKFKDQIDGLSGAFNKLTAWMAEWGGGETAAADEADVERWMRGY